MNGSSISSLFGGSRGVKGAAAPVRRFAPKAAVSTPSTQTSQSAQASTAPKAKVATSAVVAPAPPVAIISLEKPKGKAKPKAAERTDPPQPPSYEQVGELLNTLASDASEYLEVRSKPNSNKSGRAASVVRPSTNPRAEQKGTCIGSGLAPQPTVTFGENTVHEAPDVASDADSTPQSVDVRATKAKSAIARSSTLSHTKQNPSHKHAISASADIDIEFKGLKRRTADSAAATALRSKRSKTGTKASEAPVLPAAFGAGTTYTVHTVYLKKPSRWGLLLSE